MGVLQVAAVMTNFERMNDFIRKAAESAGFDAEQTNKILLACEEVLANVIHYAYQGGSGDVRIRIEPLEGEPGLVIEVSDEGMAFDPLKKEDPDINLPVAQRAIGGLGIYLMKQIMENVRYRREGNRNILTMEKRPAASPAAGTGTGRP